MYMNQIKTANQSKNRKGTHESDETSYNTVIVAAEMYSVQKFHQRIHGESEGLQSPFMESSKNKNLRFGTVDSLSLKMRRFLSPQMHNIKHAHHPPFLPPQLSQDSSIKTTEFGVSQEISFRQKRKAHRSEAIG